MVSTGGTRIAAKRGGVFKNMRDLILIAFLLLATSSLAQAPTPTKEKKAAIDHAKSQLVSSIDHGLPKVTLEFFLKYESAGAPITWEVNDCGEQTGDRATDQGRDFPMCVEADFNKDHVAVSVLISVGTFKKGLAGTPEFFSATVAEPNGTSRPVRHLSDLPKELHRPMSKSPRDLPAPEIAKATASSE